MTPPLFVRHKPNLIIHDTTLRDGEQAPGIAFSRESKVLIAKQLSRLGVTVIEAGFPCASPEHYESVKQIAQEAGPLMEGREKLGQPAIIAAFARMIEKDIRRTYEAISYAPRHRLLVFSAISDLHLKYKLCITRHECLSRIRQGLALATALCNDVWLGLEDANRADPELVFEVVEICQEMGVQTLVIADTVGSSLPGEFGELIQQVRRKITDDRLVLGVHCHNDLGLATANTLAAVQNGARHVEVTISGIGERAGNTALEEVVMAIDSHPDSFPVTHAINTKLLCETAALVAKLGGFTIPQNKPLVGRFVFTHESGIHQHGMLANRNTYEFVHPEDVGATGGLVLGKNSGRHAVRDRLLKLGYGEPTPYELGLLCTKVKILADSKPIVEDDDLIKIIGKRPGGPDGEFHHP
ncbi:2-isopropylmalate synthase (Alpha-isopropylmalate synthase) (Alpha-IPM synthetase) [Dimargaris xerosporica]|nr:2-isopropylmalate synthase (Alpha-isopropylmalate synthase) (Alpha-IPM synthetase) [Dimargaris xerosporica]